MMPQVTKCLDQLNEARKAAQELMTRAQTLWIKHKVTPKYEEEDMVWLDGRNIRTEQPAPSLRPEGMGHFPSIR